MDVNKILQVVFEEARKMPGKDLRVNLKEIRMELDKQLLEVIADLTILKDASKRATENLKRVATVKEGRVK